MTSYAILLVLAIVVNIGDIKMLALSIVIGAGIFFPVPAQYFYQTCAFGEFLIALAAFKLDAAASKTIVRISMFLLLFHFMGFILDGYPPESPYHIMVKTFEHAELLACILMSTFLMKKIKL